MSEEEALGKVVTHRADRAGENKGSFFEVFTVALRLGLSSFGGPIAHLGYFREEYVVRKKWIDDRSYGDLVALCQFSPGPASSQVGMAIGIARAGVPGALAAWLGFTLPSALALVLFAFGLERFGEAGASGWLGGLKIVAAAVVAQAVWGMACLFCVDRYRVTVAIFAAIATLTWQSAAAQIIAIIAGGLFGWILSELAAPATSSPVRFQISKPLAIGAWVVLLTLLFTLPLLRQFTTSRTLEVFDSFFRVGSLVFAQCGRRWPVESFRSLEII
jgi:chromate transporter